MKIEELIDGGEGKLDMPDAVNAACALVEECRVMWK